MVISRNYEIIRILSDLQKEQIWFGVGRGEGEGSAPSFSLSCCQLRVQLLKRGLLMPITGPTGCLCASLDIPNHIYVFPNFCNLCSTISLYYFSILPLILTTVTHWRTNFINFGQSELNHPNSRRINKVKKKNLKLCGLPLACCYVKIKIKSSRQLFHRLCMSITVVYKLKSIKIMIGLQYW